MGEHLRYIHLAPLTVGQWCYFFYTIQYLTCIGC